MGKFIGTKKDHSFLSDLQLKNMLFINRTFTLSSYNEISIVSILITECQLRESSYIGTKKDHSFLSDPQLKNMLFIPRSFTLPSYNGISIIYIHTTRCQLREHYLLKKTTFYKWPQTTVNKLSHT